MNVIEITTGLDVKPCAVYLVRAVGLGVVYVGIADDFEVRWRQHRRSSWWLGEVVVDEIEVYGMASREAARQMEAAVINRSHPRYNTALELGAYARYQEATQRDEDDSWPVQSVAIYDGEGAVQWTSEV